MKMKLEKTSHLIRLGSVSEETEGMGFSARRTLVDAHVECSWHREVKLKVILPVRTVNAGAKLHHLAGVKFHH